MTDTFTLAPDLDQVRATVQALQGAATLLQGAMEQRAGLWSEVRDAEQALARVQQQRAEAQQALAAAQAHLERTTRNVEQIRSEQRGLVADFEQLVQGALERRRALMTEISDLEQRRDGLLPVLTPVVEPPVVEAEPTPTPTWQPVPMLKVVEPTPSVPSVTTAVHPTWDPFALQEPAAPPVEVQTVEVMEVMPVGLKPADVQTVEAEPVPITPVAVHNSRRVLRPGFGFRHALQVLLGSALVGLAVLLTPITQLAGGPQLLAVMSGSMEPTIHVGGIVGVAPVSANQLQVGDVITFANANNPDVLITHRIVSLEDSGGQMLITTKGDANDSVDAVSATPSRAVGKVLFTLPWLGYLMVWMASPIAKAGIIAAAVAGFVLPSFKRGSSAAQAEAPQQPRPQSQPSDSYAALEREIEALLPSR